MNHLIDAVLEATRSAWRFRWWGLVAVYVVAVPGWLYIFALQDRYEASARIFVDTLSPLHPALQGLTVDQDVVGQLNFVRQSLLDGPQLETIARETGVLTAQTQKPRDQERVLQELQKRVGISVSSASPRDNERATAGSIYDITYRDNNRTRSLRVVQMLLTTLIEHTQGGKRAGAESAQKFLETQIRQHESQLRAAEDRLTQFKGRNLSALPAEQGGYFAQLQAELTATEKAQTSLSIALSRRAELDRQLRSTALTTATVGTPTLGVPGKITADDTVSRIRETEAELDELRVKFTEQYPQVVETREKLHDLQLRRAAELERLRGGDPNAIASSGASANPVYQNIQVALNSADLEIASLRSELQQHAIRTKELRQKLESTSRVESDYATLTRDYNASQAEYSALLANYAKARLGEQADSAGAVRFEILQPPRASIMPVFPMRGPLLAAVLGGALFVGAVLAYLLHLLRPVVGSMRNLAELTQLPVLGVVGLAFPEQPSRAERAASRRFTSLVAGLLLAFAAVLWLNRQGVRLTGSTWGNVVRPMDSVPGRTTSLAGTGRDTPPEARKEPTRTTVNVITNGASLSRREPSRIRSLNLDRVELRKRRFLPDADQERQFADYYRRIKRPIIAQALVQTPDGATDLRLVMLTSALPGDGKTFTSLNLALSIAREQDVSVVLVDADVAKLHLSRILGVERAPGLLDAVVHPGLDVESAILPTNIPGLSILSAGTQRENATELLASVRMTQVVDRIIAANPRRIALFDSPPLLSSSESRAMVQISGQVVLVVRSNVTPQRAVLEAIRCVPENKPLGLVLNGRVASLTEKYYAYGDYYTSADEPFGH